jgi:preprotein translocase subunit YajC
MLENILLQATNGGSGFNPGSLLLFGGIIIVFYFFMIRPQQKKQKEQKKFITEIKKGDKVVTIGGIHGRIAEMADDSAILEVEKGGKIKIEKSSISLEASQRAYPKNQ